MGQCEGSWWEILWGQRESSGWEILWGKVSVQVLDLVGQRENSGVVGQCEGSGSGVRSCGAV